MFSTKAMSAFIYIISLSVAPNFFLIFSLCLDLTTKFSNQDASCSIKRKGMQMMSLATAAVDVVVAAAVVDDAVVAVDVAAAVVDDGAAAAVDVASASKTSWLLSPHSFFTQRNFV